ncbi:MAG: hypothetical protein U0X20_04705 [Caldilineaceae bacterium]
MTKSAKSDPELNPESNPDKTVVLEVETVDQIFNSFDANPFSELATAALGEAALERVVTRLQFQPLQDWDNAQLVVRLPSDQVTPDLQHRLSLAIDRYCQARIEQNDLQVKLGRRQHAIGMVAVTVLVLAVMATAYLLFNTVWAGASQTVVYLVAASISVFAWVILWDPLEALVFDWAPPARENRALAHIMDMDVVVQSRS